MASTEDELKEGCLAWRLEELVSREGKAARKGGKRVEKMTSGSGVTTRDQKD